MKLYAFIGILVLMASFAIAQDIKLYDPTPDSIAEEQAVPAKLLWINYTKPNGAFNATWLVKMAYNLSNPPYNYSIMNWTIHPDCLSRSILEFRLNTVLRSAGPSESAGYCVKADGSLLQITDAYANSIGPSYHQFQNLTDSSYIFDQDWDTFAWWSDVDQTYQTGSQDNRSGEQAARIYEQAVWWDIGFGVDDCTSFQYPLLNITYKNEFTLESITANNNYNFEITIDSYAFSFSGSAINKTDLSFCSKSNLTAGQFYSLIGTINLDKTNYVSRLYEFTSLDPLLLTTNPLTNLTLYLIDETNSTEVSFTVQDAGTREVLEGAQGTLYRLFNGTYQLVGSKVSDIVGKLVYDYVEGQQYAINITRSGYNRISTRFNPITSDSYDVFMTPLIAFNQSGLGERLYIDYTPKKFTENQSTTFSLTVYSPYDELDEYGYNISYPGGQNITSGVNPSGETLTVGFNVGEASTFDQVTLTYYYDTELTGRQTFTELFDIEPLAGNNTLARTGARTYGMGIIERILIVVGLSVLVAGIGAMLGALIPGMFLVFAFQGYLAYVGFIPVWIILLPLFSFIIILGGRSE